MVNKFASLTVVFALICTLSGTNASASTPSDPDANAKNAEVALESGNPAKKGVQPHDRLRGDMQKLIAEARAGKVAPAARPQIQPAKSNNLSKGAKIAIGVGIAVVVIAFIVKYQKDHFFDCRSRCVL